MSSRDEDWPGLLESVLCAVVFVATVVLFGVVGDALRFLDSVRRCL